MTKPLVAAESSGDIMSEWRRYCKLSAWFLWYAMIVGACIMGGFLAGFTFLEWFVQGALKAGYHL
jgi:hypothetical protein